ncbi:neprilysin-1, partial [Caerostris darwini]
MHMVLGYKHLTKHTYLLQKKNAEKLISQDCNRRFCSSKDCVSIASRILQLMNPDANPCTDFYEYSCGGYAKSKDIPFGHNSFSPDVETKFNTLLKIKEIMEGVLSRNESRTTRKMKQLYDSCMKSEQRNAQQKLSLENWFSEIELSLTNLQSDDTASLVSHRAWMRLASRLEEYQIHTIVKPYFKSSTETPIEKIEVDCIVPFFYPNMNLKSSGEENKNTFMYKYIMENVLKLLPMDTEKRQQLITDVIEMETDITRAIEQSEVSSGHILSPEYTQLLRDLWRTIIGEAVQEIEIVSICQYDLESILSTINNAEPEKAVSYVTWRMLSQLIQYLGSDYRNLHLRFMSELSGWDYGFESKWQECSDLIRKEFGLAAYKALLDAGYIQIRQIQETKDAFLEVKRNFLHTFQSVEWAKGSVKNLFLNKIQTMKLNLGLPDRITQQDVLESVYQDLEFEDNFFLNVMNLKKFKTRYFFISLWQAHSESSVNQISIEDNPFGGVSNYDYNSNTVHVDIGLFQPPTFMNFGNIPKYFKFGEYSLLAREMTHAFDATGTFYDGTGDRWEKIWWPQIVEEKFDFYIQCLQNQTALLRNSSEDFNVGLLNTVIVDIGSFLILYGGLSAHLETWGKETQLPGVNLTKSQIYYVRVAQ